MSRSQKPEALFMYEEGYSHYDPLGMFTLRCKTPEQAQAAMLDLLEGDGDFLDNYEESNGEPFELDPSLIKRSRRYIHRNCSEAPGQETIGDPTCCLCGEPLNGRGRPTFTYDLEV